MWQPVARRSTLPMPAPYAGPATKTRRLAKQQRDAPRGSDSLRTILDWSDDSIGNVNDHSDQHG
jgi:hypothetical protein